MDLLQRATRTQTPRCPRCAEPLLLRRAQISPPAWGALLITEWYACGGCRSQYAYSPVENRWAAAAYE